MKQIFVRDIMSGVENIPMISPFAPVRDLLVLMSSNDRRFVIVERTNEHDAFGIVTYTNVLEAIFSEDGDMDLMNVYDIATKPIMQIVSDLDIRYAAQLMVRYGVKHLIVTWEGELTGLVSMHDIASVLMEEAKKSM
jgi:CBS domain-containing protein